MNQIEFERLSRTVLNISTRIRSAESLLQLSCLILDAGIGILLKRTLDTPIPEIDAVYPAEKTELIEKNIRKIYRHFKSGLSEGMDDGISLEMPVELKGQGYSDALVAPGGHTSGLQFPKYEMVLLKNSGSSNFYTSYHCWAASLLLKEFEFFKARQMIDQELERARQIQRKLFPPSPVIPGWQIEAFSQAARQTSGDFFDFIRLDDDHLGIVIADVEGKGMGAALLMTLARSLIRTYAVPIDRPNQTLSDVNRRLRIETPDLLYVSVFYGILNLKMGIMTYCNAGHETPCVINPSADGTDASIVPLLTSGVPLGLFDDFSWEQHHVMLHRGDSIFFLTDGITNTENSVGERFGSQRLHDVLARYAVCPAMELSGAVINDVDHFSNGVPQPDDMTFIIIKHDA